MHLKRILAHFCIFQSKILQFDFSFYVFYYHYYFLKFLFLAALGLRCCAGAFSSCGERELLFLAMCGLLTAVPSLVVEHGL